MNLTDDIYSDTVHYGDVDSLEQTKSQHVFHIVNDGDIVTTYMRVTILGTVDDVACGGYEIIGIELYSDPAYNRDTFIGEDLQLAFGKTALAAIENEVDRQINAKRDAARFAAMVDPVDVEMRQWVDFMMERAK